MQRLVREGMDAGAVGLSTGLDYIPSRYADAREIAALCEAIAPTTASTSPTCGATARTPPPAWPRSARSPAARASPRHVSHYNGPADLLLPLIDRGPRRGARPDLRHVPVPRRQHDPRHGRPARLGPGGRDRADPRPPGATRPIRGAARTPSGSRRPRRTRSTRSTIAMVADPDWRWAEGLTVTEAADARRAGRRGTSSARSSLASGMAVGVVGFRPGDRTEADVRAILRHPAHMAGSDGIFCGGFPHPRGWGAFARYLGHHTRDLGDYTWAEAVTHLATHAARRFRLTDRGLIRPGFVADIAIFDPATVTDRSTYAAGRALAEGVRPRPRQRHPRPATTASRPAPPAAGHSGGAEIFIFGRSSPPIAIFLTLSMLTPPENHEIIDVRRINPAAEIRQPAGTIWVATGEHAHGPPGPRFPRLGSLTAPPRFGPTPPGHQGRPPLPAGQPVEPCPDAFAALADEVRFQLGSPGGPGGLDGRPRRRLRLAAPIGPRPPGRRGFDDPDRPDETAPKHPPPPPPTTRPGTVREARRVRFAVAPRGPGRVPERVGPVEPVKAGRRVRPSRPRSGRAGWSTTSTSPTSRRWSRGPGSPSSHVVSLIVNGQTWADILRSHPELTEDDIRVCVAFAVAQDGDEGLIPTHREGRLNSERRKPVAVLDDAPCAPVSPVAANSRPCASLPLTGFPVECLADPPP